MIQIRLISLTALLLITKLIFAQQGDDDWETVFEKSGFTSTADHSQTMDFFRKINDYSDEAIFFSNFTSPQQRDMGYLFVSSSDNISDISGNKPLVLIINGIHPGEIEGKDASMLLLREILITKEKKYLLDSVNLMVIPIFNVDGHERKSKFNRINQNGPEEMGWRTTAQNLNLNRDWMKTDSPEMKWLLMQVKRFQPDFIIDTHTTDGADYQYTVTYSVEYSKNMFKETAEWLDNKFVPFLENGVEEKGFLIYPYIYLKNWTKGLDEGLIYWPATPRFSTGYFALKNRPALLVETHMLKPFKERVYSTKAVLETTIEFIYRNSTRLKELNRKADNKALQLEGKYLPISYSNTEDFEIRNFKGFEYYWDSSEVSGTQKLVYTHNKNDFQVKYYDEIVVSDSVEVPKGYLIPLEWNDLHFYMTNIHGIKSELMSAGEELMIEKFQFSNVKFDANPYEGRQRAKFDFKIIREKLILSRDMIYIPVNQRDAKVIVNLLEPISGDSYIQWGFMNQIFEQKEYYEDYVMEKLAVEMLADDPELKKEFEEKLITDEAFRNSSKTRLDFFYERSPYPDKQLNIYPILRVIK